MKFVTVAVSFIIGAACSGVGTWFSTKKYYDKKAQQEISKAREAFHTMLKKERKKNDNRIEEDTKKDNRDVIPEKEIGNSTKDHVVKKTYDDILIGLGYKDIPQPNSEESYPIDQGMFGNSGYPTLTFTWYVQDNILCETVSGKIIKEIEDLIGSEGMDILCVSEVDHFFIRNDVFKIDICIDMEYDTYYHDDHAIPD